jgi:hypothetical protein
MSDENSFWSPDLAKPIDILILTYFTNELLTMFVEPVECIN